MKASAEIKGLRVISISDGREIGKIRDLVLNPQEGKLDFFILDQESDYLGAKVISFADIVGLGEFALTIPNPEVIKNVADSQEVQQLLQLGIEVVGTKVLTKKGALIGEVTEIYYDEETGKVAQCLMSDNQGASYTIEGGQIITYGKELLIVENAPNEAKSVTKTQEASQPTAQEEKQVPINSDSAQTDKEADEFNLFEQRQLQYFIGKSVTQDVVLDNGEVLPAGEVMTEETVRQITTRSKLMEITSLLQKN